VLLAGDDLSDLRGVDAVEVQVHLLLRRGDL
jgi:hypothetical protein